MNRGTASVVQLGKGVTAGSFSGLNVLTNVILGKKDAIQKDFNGLVLTDLVMLGKKISHITIITVTVGPAVSPLLLSDAIADSLQYVKAFGGTELSGTPTPTNPVPIMTNNGELKVNKNLFNQNDVINGYVTGSTGAKVTAHSSAKTFIIPCKPRTKYTFYFDNSMVSSSRCSISGFNKKPEIDSANIQGVYINNEPKIHSVTFTTGANVHYLALWLVYSFSDSNMQNALKTVKVMEGTSANDVYVDGTVETVSVIPNERENHFVQYINAYLRSSTRSIVAYNGNSVVTFDCEVGKTYCCINRAMLGNSTLVSIGYSNTVPTTGYVYAQNDFEATPIVDGFYKTTGLVFTAKKRYATFIFRYDNDRSQNPTSMLEQMIFYETSKAQSATCEPLLAVGDYKDVQEILSGAVTRNIGIKIFDGTEDWVTMASTNQYIVYSLPMTNCGSISDWSARTGDCTHFDNYIGTVPPTYNDAPLYSYWQNKPGTYLRFKTDVNYPTVESFKQFLADQYNAGTPVIIVYPLATPTTESVAGQTLQVQAGDNTLEITQASIDGLELEAQYEQGVQASVQEVEP